MWIYGSGQLFYDMTEIANRLTRFTESQVPISSGGWMDGGGYGGAMQWCCSAGILNVCHSLPFRPVTGDFMFVNRRAERCLRMMTMRWMLGMMMVMRRESNGI